MRICDVAEAIDACLGVVSDLCDGVSEALCRVVRVIRAMPRPPTISDYRRLNRKRKRRLRL